MGDLRAPFPWFGGKSRAASLVWDALGDVPNYVEPFFGSGAVLLARPHAPRVETVNDKDAWLANFWRAVAADPDAVARHADWPVNETDLHARHQYLVDSADFLARMVADPDHFDARRAGWWVWGACAWIGSGWCDPKGARAVPHLGNAGQGVNRQLPHLGDGGKGETASSLTSATAPDAEHRQLPHAGNAGRGVHRKMPHAGDAGRGVPTQLPDLCGSSTPDGQHWPNHGKGINGARVTSIHDWMRALADRLRRVRVACGDWTRVCGPSVTHKHGLTGVFLDPPYGEGSVDYTGGGNATLDITSAVRAWAIENGEHPQMRIALCGYEGQHEMPSTWRVAEWKAKGGYGNQRTDGTTNANARRERIWFSPHCLGARQPSLFGGAA